MIYDSILNIKIILYISKVKTPTICVQLDPNSPVTPMSPRSKRALVTRETGENRALQRDSIARHVTPITEHVAAKALELHEEPIGSTFAATAVRDPWGRRDPDSEARTSFTGAEGFDAGSLDSESARMSKVGTFIFCRIPLLTFNRLITLQRIAFCRQ